MEGSQLLEKETIRRKQEEKINKLSDEIKFAKKDIEMIRHDVKTILSILKGDQNNWTNSDYRLFGLLT